MQGRLFNNKRLDYVVCSNDMSSTEGTRPRSTATSSLAAQTSSSAAAAAAVAGLMAACASEGDGGAGIRRAGYLTTDYVARGQELADLTSSQTDMAEAGVSALAKFSIPPAFDAAFFNQPDASSVIVHSCESSYRSGGFQAILCLSPKPEIPAHLGLPALNSYEDLAFLQVAPRNQHFLPVSTASRSLTLQASVVEYLTLMNFVAGEWPRLLSKFKNQLKTMREGKEPMPITGNLTFYSHGHCFYRISLSSRLIFKAKVDSRMSKEDDSVRCWLELKKGGSNSNSPQEFVLAMESVLLLAKDTNAIKALADIVDNYKRKSRKRSLPVGE